MQDSRQAKKRANNTNNNRLFDRRELHKLKR